MAQQVFSICFDNFFAEYEVETKRLIGLHLPHDDSVNDRNPGSKLCNSEEQTRKLWKLTFDMNFSRNGAMFRGDPPNGKLWELSKEFQKSLLNGAKYVIDINGHKLIQWRCDSSEEIEKNSRNEVYLKANLTYYPLRYGSWERKIKHLPRMHMKNVSNKTMNFGLNTNDNPEFSFEENSNISLEFEIESRKQATDCFCLNYEKIKTLAESANGILFEDTLMDNEEWSSKNFDFNHKLLGKFRYLN